MRKTVSKIKTTLEIKPGVVYLLKTGKIWTPVSIFCTEQPGWQRGHVSLTYLGAGRAHAHAKSIEHPRTQYEIGVHRIKDVWHFDNIFDGLTELTEDWVNSKIKTLTYEVSVLNTQVAEKLKEIQNLQGIKL